VWIAGSSNWNNQANWSQGIPGAGAVVSVTNTNGASFQVAYDRLATVTLGTLTLNTSPGTATIIQSANNLASTVEVIGSTGNGAFVQSGGVNQITSFTVGINTFGGTLVLGSAASGTGVYALSGTGSLIGASEIVGSTGFGFFNQSGGTNSAGLSLSVGGSTGTGVYVLSNNGTLNSQNVTEFVGQQSGTGTFNQSGGFNTGTELEVGYLFGTGSYTLSGGVLNIFQDSIGNLLGTGAFIQTGGQNSARLVLGEQGNGSYSLSGGTLTSTTSSLRIGYGGNGIGAFTQSGGIASINVQVLDIGDSAIGSYALSGNGTLSVTVGLEVIGDDGGTGSFIQSGGMHSITDESLIVGTDSVFNGLKNLTAGSGSYVLSNTGTLSSTAGEIIGYSGVGNFNQSGGLNTASFIKIGTIDLSSLGQGSYFLSGGLLSTGSIAIGKTGTGTLTISGTGQLICNGTVQLYPNTNSSIHLSGGTFIAQAANISAAFVQNAGTASFGNITGAGAMTITGGQTSLNNGGGRSQVASLIVSGSGLLDIGNNSLAINFGSPANDPVVAIAADLATGYNGGAWTGTAGIVSSTAAAGAPLLSVGYADGNVDSGTAAAPNQILIMQTKAGDANLDGVVDIKDLNRVAANYGMTTGARWAQGDFDYDGGVDVDDLNLLLANYSLPGRGAIVFADPALLGDSQAVSLLQSDGFDVVPLPEPTTAVALIVPALLSVRRRRPRRQ
jgi:hypothetical protein